ncbi:uncharacterized protein phf11 isoform X2 [Vanacampus margaritifer]
MHPSQKLVCVLCQRAEETETTAALLTKDDVTAHQNCLLFSSGIYCKDSPLFDDLFGFDAEDVRGEVKRGSKLLCAKCRRKGATVGCEVSRCQKCYHYPCAVEDVAKTVVDDVKGKYVLFCFKHSADQQQRNGDSSSDECDVVPSGLATKSSSPTKRQTILADMQASMSSKKMKIMSDSSSSGDDGPPQILAPIEDSDLDESFNLKPWQVANSQSLLDPEKTSNRMPSTNVIEVKVEKGQEAILDAATFWRHCNMAGCTDAIFSHFLTNMKDVSQRIQQEQASQEDLDVAFKVMMASGKMTQLLRKQLTEMEQKHVLVQKSLAAMQQVMSLLRS